MRKAIFLVLSLVLLIILASCNYINLLHEIEKNIPWDATNTYSAGDYCQELGTVYESKQDGNLDHEPVSSPAWWALE